MAKQVPIPKFGQTVETVSLVAWHKAEGDTVAKGEVLFEVETDKAVLEVESQFEGTLLKIAIPEGAEDVAVMSIAAVIGAPGEEIPKIQQPKAEPAAAPDATAAAEPQPSKPARATAAAPREHGQPAGPAPVEQSPTPAAAPQPDAGAVAAPTKRHRTSPRARRFAKQFLVKLDEIEQISGSGPGGRVVERDVRGHLEASGYFERKITPAAANLAREFGLSLLDIEPTGATGRVTLADVRRAEAEQPKPMSKMRRTIARRLQQSKQQAPHFYVTVRVDMTDLGVYRQALKDSGIGLSFNTFVLKACAGALAEFPQVNSFTPDGINVTWHSAVNIGMAVDVDNGLVVPVIPNVDTMPVDEIQAAAGELAEKARNGKLLPDDMQGATFTVSNMGMLGVDSFTAIINPGESAILAVGSIIPTPVVGQDRQVVVRDIMKMTLSADHRTVDGAMAARFANAIKRRLEDISFWKNELAV